MPLSADRKKEYFERMKSLLAEYSKLFVVSVDNVGSKQLQMTRMALRGKAEILMGKNTMMRKVIREFVEENPDSPIAQLEECCRGNIGFVFCSGSLGDVREVVESNVRPAPAKVGAVAPCKVVVPKGPTGCDPGQTAFFQTLQIATKITRGQIEMVNDTDLIQEGERVTASQAALLQKLSIEPFTYGMILRQVYDNGSLFSAKVLDITDDVLASKFAQALSTLASLSLAMGYPTQASVPHSIVNAYKAVLAVTIQLDSYSFDKADMVKEYLKDPSKFAGSGGGGGGGGGGGAGAAAAEPEPEEEEEADIGGGIGESLGKGRNVGGFSWSGVTHVCFNISFTSLQICLEVTMRGIISILAVCQFSKENRVIFHILDFFPRMFNVERSGVCSNLECVGWALRPLHLKYNTWVAIYRSCRRVSTVRIVL